MDVDCNKCRAMKEGGYARPTCEECGKIDLSQEQALVWGLVNQYHRVLINYSGTGWSMNFDSVCSLAEKYMFDSPYDLLDRVLPVFEILLKKRCLGE